MVQRLELANIAIFFTEFSMVSVCLIGLICLRELPRPEIFVLAFANGTDQQITTILVKGCSSIILSESISGCHSQCHGHNNAMSITMLWA